jgi:IS30 family transposase
VNETNSEVLVEARTQYEIERDLRLHTSQITPELIAYIVNKIVARFAPHKIITQTTWL